MTTKGFDLDSLRCMVTKCGKQASDRWEYSFVCQTTLCALTVPLTIAKHTTLLVA